MTITLCNGKGGAGKSTLAVLLGLAFEHAGRSVDLVDTDPQRTAQRWSEGIGAPRSPPAGAPAVLRVIDTPPRLDSPGLHRALAAADCVLLVTSPSPADLWGSQDTVEVIRQHLPSGRPARILFNQVQRRTLLAQGLDGLAHRIGLPALAVRIGRRQAFQHAALCGWPMLDRESQAEVTAAAREILELLSPPLPQEGPCLV